MDLPHYDWPLTFTAQPDGTVGFALVEQDTPDDLQATAALIASVPRGHRDDDPSFGVSDLAFQQGPVDTDLFAAELAQADDRLADLDATELLDVRDATRRTVRVTAAPAHQA